MGFKKGNTLWKHPKAVAALEKNHENPWNRGIKTGIVPKSAIKKGEHLSPNTEFKKGESVGANNHLWKGEQASYRAIHHWVERHRGKASVCALDIEGNCSKKFSWANISHEYKRDLNDWMPLCYRHHKLYDLANRKEIFHV